MKREQIFEFNFIAAIIATIVALGLATFVPVRAYAATLAEDAQLVAVTPTLLQVAPEQKSFTVATAGSIHVTLADIGTPAPLTSVSLIVTSGSKSVLRLTKVGSGDFDATPGTYSVRVLGSGPKAGTLDVAVTTSNPNTELLHYQAGIAVTPSSSNPNKSSLQDKITIVQAGAYQVTVSDRQFPVALDSVDVLIASQDGAQTFRVCVPSTASVCTLGLPLTSGPIQLDALAYDVFINATAATTTNTGLFSIEVSGGSGSIYSAAVPVGILRAESEVNFPAADSYSLALSDFQFPAALGQVKAMIIQGSNVLGSLTAAGSTIFNAGTGKASLYIYASPGASAQAGSFDVQVRRGSTAIYDNARAVTAANATVRAFAFTGNVATGGAYRVQLKDFGFPSAIPQLQMIVTRSGAALASVSAAGTVDAQMDGGPIVVLALADMLSSTATGLFGVSIGSTGAGAIFEATQGVGDLFQTRTITTASSGNLDISLADLGFPAAFADLALAVTRGTNLVGQIFGGGKFTFAATPGDYSLNFIARAGANSSYGLYGAKVEDTPSPPAVVLSANPSTVNSGGTTTVSWSATGATSCVASGGWSGNLDATGSMNNVGPFTSDSTLKLTCTGVGGTSSATTNIAIVATKSNGGGAMPMGLIVSLGLLAFRRRWRVDSRASN